MTDGNNLGITGINTIVSRYIPPTPSETSLNLAILNGEDFAAHFLNNIKGKRIFFHNINCINQHYYSQRRPIVYADGLKVYDSIIGDENFTVMRAVNLEFPENTEIAILSIRGWTVESLYREVMMDSGNFKQLPEETAAVNRKQYYLAFQLSESEIFPIVRCGIRGSVFSLIYNSFVNLFHI